MSMMIANFACYVNYDIMHRLPQKPNSHYYYD